MVYITNNPLVDKVITDIKERINMSVKSSCESVVNNSQVIKFGGITATNCDVRLSGITQDMNNKVTANCFQSDNFKEMVENAIRIELTKLRTEGKVALANEVQTIIDKELNIEQVSNCMSKVFNEQKMDFGDFNLSCPERGSLTIDNITQQITSDTMMNCIQTENPDVLEQLGNIPDRIALDISDKEEEEGLSQEAIIGISVGVILVLALIASIVATAVIISRKPTTTT